MQQGCAYFIHKVFEVRGEKSERWTIPAFQLVAASYLVHNTDGLQVADQVVELCRGLSEVSDNCHGGGDDLAGLALLVELAQAAPLAQILGGSDLEEWDALLCAEGLQKQIQGRQVG
jgi:hypothetical protein